MWKLGGALLWSLAHTFDFGEWWPLCQGERTLGFFFTFLFLSYSVSSHISRAASVMTVREFCILSKEQVHLLASREIKFILQCLPPFLFSLSLFFFFFFTNFTLEKPKEVLESMKVRWRYAFKLLIWLV